MLPPLQRVSAYMRSLNIRAKLFLGYSLILISSLLILSFLVYSLMRNTVEASITRELKNSTQAILNTVRTSASVSIKNYLRSVAEKNVEIVRSIYDRQQAGELSNQEAKNLAIKIFVSQTIGKTGYIYCVDSSGVAVVHPHASVAGHSFSGVGFVEEQIRRKHGYLEYFWRIPGEQEGRSKALYMSYFEPWDWIISASSYREEFKDLVKVSDFSETILARRFGKSGYCFVLDSLGNVVVHPILKGNLLDAVDSEGNLFVRDLCRLKNGTLTYSWRNPGENRFREKMVIFNYIPEYDWIVGSSGYMDEIYEPLLQFRTFAYAAIIATLALIMPLTLLISASIIRPMRELIGRLTAATAGDLSVRMLEAPNDEIGQLSRHFNIFMEKLESYHQHLQSETSRRRRLEREVLNISEREKQKFGLILHDDLCPHLIGIEVLIKVLRKKLEQQNGCEDQAASTEKIRELVSEAIAKTRDLARGLMPVEAARHGLETSLAGLAENVARVYNINCLFTATGSVDLNNNTSATHIYYIVHEAVHNAVKHGKAGNVSIELSRPHQGLKIEIVDDGGGLPEKPDSKGLGLNILRYRTDCLEGKLEISSNPGAGVRVRLSVPLSSLQ